MSMRSGISPAIGSTGMTCSPNTSTSFSIDWNSSTSSREGTVGRQSYPRRRGFESEVFRELPDQLPNQPRRGRHTPRAPAHTSYRPDTKSKRPPNRESGSYAESSKPTSAVIDGTVVSSTLLCVFPVEDILAHALCEAGVSADRARA
ncbi:hypothetical protein ISCGN_002527 [Ixodes scapularis]